MAKASHKVAHIKKGHREIQKHAYLGLKTPSQEAEDEDFYRSAPVERFDEAKRTAKHGKSKKAEILQVERSQGG
jgi:hypothetical protein